MVKKRTKFRQILQETNVKQIDIMRYSDEMFPKAIGESIISRLANEINTDNYTSTIVRICAIFRIKYGVIITPNDLITNPHSTDMYWQQPYFNPLLADAIITKLAPAIYEQMYANAIEIAEKYGTADAMRKNYKPFAKLDRIDQHRYKEKAKHILSKI